jgi:hypothetical protein
MPKALSLQRLYNIQRLKDALTYVENASLRNPAEFVLRALEENWTVGSGLRRTVNNDHLAANHYITGKYAEFIEH